MLFMTFETMSMAYCKTAATPVIRNVSCDIADYVDGLTQDCGNSYALAMECPQFCAKSWLCGPSLEGYTHSMP